MGFPRAAVRGCSAASPAERAGFGMASAFACTIAVSRALNYVRERRRPAPTLRSWGRRLLHSPGKQEPRVHHFLPGVALSLVVGGAAILTRDDGRELMLSLPFGTGAGLVMDEASLLARLDNPYWTSENFAVVQAGLAALVSLGLVAHFNRNGNAAVRLHEGGPVDGA